MSPESYVPNEVLLEEIRINRQEIKCVSEKVGGKVGRGELYSVLGTLSAIAGTIVVLLAAAQ